MTMPGSGPSDAEVDAAVARWATAAGVPASVAQGHAPPRPVPARFLRGLLLGWAVGLPLLALTLVDETAHGLGTALVVVVLWLGVGVHRRRRGSHGDRQQRSPGFPAGPVGAHDAVRPLGRDLSGSWLRVERPLGHTDVRVPVPGPLTCAGQLGAAVGMVLCAARRSRRS